MFIFPKIWRGLLSCYLRSEIRPFALLQTNYETNTIHNLFQLFSEILTNWEVIQFEDETAIFVSAKHVNSIEFMLNDYLKNVSSNF